MKHSLIIWSITASLLGSALSVHAAVGQTTAAKPAKAVSAAPARLQQCSWDKPGHNPYMGDFSSAVDRYTDIAPAVRERLKQRIAARQYDEMVSIRRDSIVGKDVYSSAIRDMHFGNGSVCSTVSRNKWAADAEERGLVYCESGECILVPTVCRNVSRISRAGGATGAAAAGPGELAFDPPAAGEPVAAAPDALESLPPTGAGTPAVGLAAVPAVSPGLLGPIAGSSGAGGQPVLGGPISIPSAPVLPSGSLPTVPVVPPPVPEPGTWALMLGGIALLALLRQRRLAVQPVRTGRRG